MTAMTITTTMVPRCRPSHCGFVRSKSLLVEKGYVDPAALDVLIETYETKIGPRNGARVVAKAWSDPALQRGSAGCHRGHRLARLYRAAG